MRDRLLLTTINLELIGKHTQRPALDQAKTLAAFRDCRRHGRLWCVDVALLESHQVAALTWRRTDGVRNSA
jgi:hypothetical protein